MLAQDAASTGRRGPGHPGSARIFPGESASRAAGFGTGMALDVMPGCPQLDVAADAAVGGGPADRFGGTADHELIGLVCAWDRLEAHAAARKLIAVAEVFRRSGCRSYEASRSARHRKEATWEKAAELIETKRPRDYDLATSLLRDLQALADRQEDSAAFRKRFAQHQRKPSLLDRFDQAGLPS